MSGQPPPPPSRKPPAARPPMAGAPVQTASKPPVAQGRGDHPGEEPQRSGMSTGAIIGIIAAILFVLIGLPVLSCVGCIGYTRYRANQIIAEIEAQQEQARQEEEQQQRLQEQALLVLLTDRLYEMAKVDIPAHWTEPERVRRRRWADWSASKVDEDTYEITGNLELSIRDVGPKTFRWACQYSTFDDPRSVRADWTLERVSIDGEQHFP